MSLTDRARQLAARAQGYAAGNKDKISRGVEKAQRVADARTGGGYHTQITKAGRKAEQAVARLPEQAPRAAEPTSTPEHSPPEQTPPYGPHA